MKYALITFLIVMLCGTNISAQNSIPKNTLDRVEKLLLHHEIEYADSLFQQELLSHNNTNLSYQENIVKGLILYHKELYKEAISSLTTAIAQIDSLKKWNSENALKTAYYIADSYMHLNNPQASEHFIIHAFVKCAKIYDTSIYAKKMLQLLLTLYKDQGMAPSVIEQVHNEIQKIAVSIYSSNDLNKDAKEIKEAFMFFYNYTPSDREDSLFIDEGKAVYLCSIGEYEEAIRLYERVESQLPKDKQKAHEISTSLLFMYSSLGHKEAIENLLQEMRTSSMQKDHENAPYPLYVSIGYKLNQYHHFDLAQYYYERCDSFLNMNQNILEWTEKKKNVLARMVFNCNSSGAYEKVIAYCNEFEKLSNTDNYDEQYFLNYNRGKALIGLEKYGDALNTLKALKSFIQLNDSLNSNEYLMTNYLLGTCYVNTGKNDESVRCSSTAMELYKRLKKDNRGLLSSLYHNIGKAYLQKGKLKKALSYLCSSAEIQVEQTGRVSLKTQNYIDDCIRKKK